MKIVYSSGHGSKIRGASDIVDEVDEARKIVNRTAEILRSAGVGIVTFHDDVSTSQSANLDRIVNFHNSQTRDLDVSQHLNAYKHTSNPMGCEVLFVTQESLANRVSAAIAKAGGFIDRGPKYRSDLAFLNGTNKPAILIEVFFCDSQADVNLYHANFEAICHAIAESLSGQEIPDVPVPPEPEPVPPEPSPPDGIPKWLQVMRNITGMTETPGAADNPKILMMRDAIARAYPEMANYCAEYQHDETPWCGLTVAYCMTKAGIRPVFGPTDTDRFLWALAWGEDREFGKVLSRPVPGCVVVMERSGGGHVTLYESTSGSNYVCRGGNQSDAVTVASYSTSGVVALVWPKAAGEPPEIPVEDRPLLSEGDSGPDVSDLQEMLPHFTGEIDGDFGPITEDNVILYQLTRGLDVDGVVGEQTWTALYDDKPPRPLPTPPPGALTAEQQTAIRNIANGSAIAGYHWNDRGEAPRGYTQGMALSFAQTYLKLKASHPAAIEMARANTHDDEHDALSWYNSNFQSLGMSNERSGIDTLRHLYVLMLGSGMRESSGVHCCGRDQSADNVSSDTAEAGLFQTSYNASGASNPEFDALMVEYGSHQSPGFLAAFAEGVSCSNSDWDCYGSGAGYVFQKMCKAIPAFAVETHGLTLRNLRKHYGPINNKAAELRREADEMFKAVQDYMDQEAVVA